MKKLSILFTILALLLSHLMCAVVAFNYCDMLWGIRYSCYSAPAWTAFLLVLPYSIGIVICTILAFLFHKKSH